MRDIEGDGHGEEGTVDETKGRDDTASSYLRVRFRTSSHKPESGSPLVILLAHEALEGRETSVHDKLQVAELPLSQTNVGELLRLLDELLAKGGIANVEILEGTAVGRVGLWRETRKRIPSFKISLPGFEGWVIARGIASEGSQGLERTIVSKKVG